MSGRLAYRVGYLPTRFTAGQHLGNPGVSGVLTAPSLFPQARGLSFEFTDRVLGRIARRAPVGAPGCPVRHYFE
jgi:hypothetical protein